MSSKTELSHEVMNIPDGVPVRMWTRGVPVDDKARAQLANTARMPFIHKWIAVMPDVHVGKGSTIGSVIPTKGAIIPAAVGVDIGCGMMAAKTTLNARDLPDDLLPLRRAIERAVPHGRSPGTRDPGAWHEPPAAVDAAWAQLATRFAAITAKYPKLAKANHRVHLGTLGTGNHFIEVCLDEDEAVWFLLHSGSRGIGNAIGTFFIELAREDMRRWLINLPDRDLAYLPEGTAHFDDYVEAVEWAQDFARANRELMMQAVVDAARAVITKPFQTHVEAVNCFAAETPVMTRFGTRPIKELSGQIHELLTEGGQWVEAPIQSFGVQELMKVTLSRCGVLKTIHATPDHVWILSPLQRSFTTRKRTKELEAGDRLKTVYPQRSAELVPLSTGVARGFVFGDGSISSKHKSRANFCGEKDKNLLPLFIAEQLGLAPRRYANNLTVINGLPAAWKTETPDLDENPSMLFGWLSGYFAADGDVDKTGRPTLSSAKRENLEFVRLLCDRIGIGTYGIRQSMRRGFGGRVSSLYLLGLMRKDLDEAFFQIPEHRRRFMDSVKRVAERRSWNVVSVERTERVEEVFCAVVEGTHSFALEDNILVQNCHHNYVSREHHYGENILVTRKGAVRARAGELGIIPGSMGAKSFIVRGLGNPESFESCSHGAGRVLSRSEAKRRFTLADQVRETAGVECRKDADVIDEIPSAYKDIDAVMHAQRDLVEVVHTLKQLVCVKG